MHSRYSPEGARDDGIRRLSRLTWRVTQLSAVAIVGFATLFSRTATANTTSAKVRVTPPAQAVPDTMWLKADQNRPARTKARRSHRPGRRPRATATPAPAAAPAPTPSTAPAPAPTPTLTPPPAPPSPAPTPSQTTSSGSHGGG
jgi:hypothetical protein